MDQSLEVLPSMDPPGHSGLGEVGEERVPSLKSRLMILDQVLVLLIHPGLDVRHKLLVNSATVGRDSGDILGEEVVCTSPKKEHPHPILELLEVASRELGDVGNDGDEGVGHDELRISGGERGHGVDDDEGKGDEEGLVTSGEVYPVG